MCIFTAVRRKFAASMFFSVTKYLYIYCEISHFHFLLTDRQAKQTITTKNKNSFRRYPDGFHIQNLVNCSLTQSANVNKFWSRIVIQILDQDRNPDHPQNSTACLSVRDAPLVNIQMFYANPYLIL